MNLDLLASMAASIGAAFSGSFAYLTVDKSIGFLWRLKVADSSLCAFPLLHILCQNHKHNRQLRPKPPLPPTWGFLPPGLLLPPALVLLVTIHSGRRRPAVVAVAGAVGAWARPVVLARLLVRILVVSSPFVTFLRAGNDNALHSSAKCDKLGK